LPRVFRTEVTLTTPGGQRVRAAVDSPKSREGLAQAAWATPSAGPSVEPSRATSADPGHTPFYKREISFRRKRTASSEEAVAEQAHVPAAEDPADVVQPELTDTEPQETPQLTAELAQADLAPEAPLASDGASGDDGASVEDEPLVEPSVEDEPSVDAVVDPSTVAQAQDPEQSPTVATAAAQDGHEHADGEDTDDARSDEPVASAADDLVDPVSSVAAVPPDAPSKPERNGRSRRRRGGKPRRIVGLKVGATQLAAAVIAETDEGRELIQLARRPLEPGIVVDGEVRDRDALTRALKSFFQEADLPRRDVRLGVGSNRIGVRIFDIVGVEDEARFDNAVRFKAHEVLPVAVHESALDYRVLSERPTEDGQISRRVLLVVAPREQIDPLVDVAGRAGLSLLGVDLEALGLLRAFVEPVPAGTSTISDTAKVVVSIGHESSTLLVASDGACAFTRVFDWGGNALHEAIAQELDVPSAEAATILRHLSLSGPGRQLAGLDEAARASAVSVVRNRLTPFARELVNSLQFYQAQPDSLGIGRIVITGGTSHLEGLDQALHQLIGVGVTVGDPLARVLVGENLDLDIEAAIGSLAVPIGLAIEDAPMRGVDLSMRGTAKPRSRRATLVAVGIPVAAAIPLIALGAVYFGAHGTASSRSAELAEVQSEIAALPKPTGPSIDPSMGGSEAQRAMGVANVLGARIAWEKMFRDVSRVLPSNVWLDAMTATSPADAFPAAVAAAAAAAAPSSVGAPATDVTLTGATFSQIDVARLLARLATLPSLSNVRLVSATAQDNKAGKKTVQFNIVASLNSTGGAS